MKSRLIDLAISLNDVKSCSKCHFMILALLHACTLQTHGVDTRIYRYVRRACSTCELMAASRPLRNERVNHLQRRTSISLLIRSLCFCQAIREILVSFHRFETIIVRARRLQTVTLITTVDPANVLDLISDFHILFSPSMCKHF